MNVRDENVFEKINSWFDAANYALVHTGYTALYDYLIPVVITAMGCALIVLCIQAAWGGVNAPISALLQKCLKWGAMSALVLSWGHFDVWLYKVFTNGPADMGSMLIDAIKGTAAGSDNTSIIDSLGEVLLYGHIAAEIAYEGGDGWLMPGLLYITILICTYGITGLGFALLMLAKGATALMLFIAPIPLFAFMFDSTRDTFTRWIQQLLNFLMMTILTTAVLAVFAQMLLLAMPDISEGLREVTFSDIGATIIMAIVMGLLLSQIPGQATSLAGGIQLTTMGAYSAMGGKARDLAAKAGRVAGAGAKGAGAAVKGAVKGSLGKLKAVKG